MKKKKLKKENEALENIYETPTLFPLLVILTRISFKSLNLTDMKKS